MKKFLVRSAALFVIAGSTFAYTSPLASAQTKKPKKPTAQSEGIPPPNCPLSDPNGCGIYE